MMRCLIVLLISLLSTSSLAFNWRDLWLTPDQQGQSLMEKAQFAKAKEIFERTDWAASAAYKAGDYQRAAELFKNLKTEQGDYNLGNALAHLGQYERAIEAYDKALAFNPNNQDAIYNRQLVKDLMKKDKEKKQNKDEEKEKKDQNKDQDKEDQNKDQENKDQESKDQQNKDQENKDQQNKDQENKDQQNKDQENKDQQNKDQENKDQQNKDQEKKDQQNKDQEKKDQQNKDQKNKDKNQKNQQQQDKSKDQQEETQSEADLEKQQEKEQWLRLIPDDPGGLMREKFLRDHLRRERGWYQ